MAPRSSTSFLRHCLPEHWFDRLKSRVCYGKRQQLSLLLFALIFSLLLHNLDATAADTLQLPLSTRKSQIVDARGKTTLLRGVNWFGIETEMHVPHGLWQRDYKEVLAQIKSLGYNVIRLPYSVQSLRSGTISGVNFSLGSNAELQGKTPIQVMDLVIQEAQRQGLMILLDSHRLNDQRIPELWYGDGFTEADWIDTWKLLAERYKQQSNVIGADLKNEPHGQASWGTKNAATDWRLAAERAGNAILGVNPNWLIVVEGVEKNVPGQKLNHWWGANLEGVSKYPVRLKRTGKLVYSLHEYGAGVFNQPWFNEARFPANLRDRWEIGFYYIARKNIAPILIGEFGGRQVDASSKEGIWQRELVKFIKEKQLSFTYWSWNPNSVDTGGILQDDWQSIHQDKQTLLNQLLPVAAITMSKAIAMPPAPTPQTLPQPAPINSPTPTSMPAPPPTSGGKANLTVETKIQSDWQTGFYVEMQVANRNRVSSGNWKLAFEMNQAEINTSWNGNFNHQGSRYTVTPPDWARTIQPNQTVSLGFCANKLGADYQPKQVSVL